MNDLFANYATSTAFQMTMSRTASLAVVQMFKYEHHLVKRGRWPARYGLGFEKSMTRAYLLRRGLIQHTALRWTDGEKQAEIGRCRWCLTRAGIYIAKLLQECGIANNSNVVVDLLPVFILSDAELDGRLSYNPAAISQATVDSVAQTWGWPSEDLGNCGSEEAPLSVKMHRPAYQTLGG